MNFEIEIAGRITGGSAVLSYIAKGEVLGVGVLVDGEGSVHLIVPMLSLSSCALFGSGALLVHG